MYTFKKEERLCSKELITGLYHNGSSFLCYPYKVNWLLTPAGSQPAQVVFSVAKKRFKRAVARNLIKRRMREVYRLHKQQLLYNYLSTQGKTIALAIAYIGNKAEEYEFMEKKMLKVFVQLIEQIEAATPTAS